MTIASGAAVAWMALQAAAPQAVSPPRWSLADSPLLEVGRGDGMLLHEVRDATIAADGTVLIAENSEARILRVSSAGEVLGSLGREGQGEGELQRAWRVFAFGDTVLAYDDVGNRVTTWTDLEAKPETRSLPLVNGVATALLTVVSANVWILRSWGDGTMDGDSRLIESWTDVFSYDASSRVVRPLDRRHIGYGYLYRHARREGWATTTYRMSFLGRAHFASVAGVWLFAPMDASRLEIRGGEADPPRAMALPFEQMHYEAKLFEQDREYKLSIGVPRDRVGMIFDGLRRQLPERAPPVDRLMGMGGHLWVKPFEADGEPSPRPDWFVLDPAKEAVLARVAVDSSTVLLGGSEDRAVLLRRTEMGEEFVQVREVVRAAPASRPTIRPSGQETD